MKIVHLIDYFQPTLGYQEAFLAREQLRLGHDVTVVTSDRYAPFPDYVSTVQPVLGERIRPAGRGIEEGVYVWRLPVQFEYRYRCWLKGLTQALVTLRPDVLHAHNVIKLTSLQAILLKPRLGYRLVMDDHSLQIAMDQSWQGTIFYGAFRLLLAPLFRRRVDVLVAVTDGIADTIRQVYGLDRLPLHVIELGIDTQLFRPDAVARQAKRVELGLNPDDFLIVYTGKIIPTKAPHWLVEALSHCPARVKALLVGNAPADYRRQIDDIIAEHGLSDRVIFHPAVRQVELPPYYVAADAGCWPREGSMGMFEAAACGLPIVITAGELSQRVRYGNGLEYREGDVADLARCLTQLAQNPGQARTMGARGRQLVEGHLSWIEINRQFLAAYQGTSASSQNL
jgi:glycosyltransferase involved in cell wall biosynthesis